ncbi:hypothetical protein L484_016932 [Morus notabilis]|uniref:POX domain-containing protein n=1 Tax=Morus notabilis TaxID=981085 RepID=W9RVL6_9ROSA|nr:hypothetical protein L484_016932 [Morus notabilis]
MATYFHGNSEIQAATDGGLQTLVLMNPTGYIPYSDSPPPPHSAAAQGNLFFLNSAAAALAHHHAPPQQQQPQQATQHFVPAANDLSALHGFIQPPRVQYNLWKPSPDPSAVARDTPRAGQGGLSLTLSSQQLGFGSPSSQAHAPPHTAAGEDMRVSGGSSSSVSGITNGASGIQSVLLSSKYLKAAQELLDEVVNVGNGIGAETARKRGRLSGSCRRQRVEMDRVLLAAEEEKGVGRERWS